MTVTDARRPGALPTLLAALLVAGPAAASETYWDYGAEYGPTVWAGLSEDFSTCGEGRAQSPIDLPEAVPVPDFIDSSMLSGFRAASIAVTHQEHTNEIIIDRCPKCKGVWLDAGEIEAIKEAAMNEGMATGKFHGVMMPTTPTGSRWAQALLWRISLGTTRPKRRRPSPAM